METAIYAININNEQGKTLILPYYGQLLSQQSHHHMTLMDIKRIKVHIEFTKEASTTEKKFSSNILLMVVKAYPHRANTR
jgi:hypothetical protein